MWSKTLLVLNLFLFTSCDMAGLSSLFRGFGNPFSRSTVSYGDIATRESRCESLINIQGCLKMLPCKADESMKGNKLHSEYDVSDGSNARWWDKKWAKSGLSRKLFGKLINCSEQPTKKPPGRVRTKFLLPWNESFLVSLICDAGRRRGGGGVIENVHWTMQILGSAIEIN